MAHFIFEYSANLPEDLLDMPGLMAKLHAAAADTGVFPLSGIRSRAHRCEEYRVADGDPACGFVNLSMKVGAGRDGDTRLQVGRQLFDTMVEHLQPLLAQHNVALSFEMRELDELAKFNHRNF